MTHAYGWYQLRKMDDASPLTLDPNREDESKSQSDNTKSHSYNLLILQKQFSSTFPVYLPQQYSSSSAPAWTNMMWY